MKTTTAKIFQDRAGTPATKGLPLLQQISSAGLKQGSKKKQAIHVRATEKQRVKAEQDHCQKETMLPFTDKGMDKGVYKSTHTISVRETQLVYCPGLCI